jgi:hypothetical protein
MKRFLAVFTGTADGWARSGWDALDEAERARRQQAGIQAWNDWGTRHAASIVDNGAPLGPTKLIGPDGIGDTTNQLAAYAIVEAESLEAAARLFEGHPPFTIFPGDGVEVMECLPIPGG